jgi:hypothetical protein
MGRDDVDVSLIEAAAARGCDECGGLFHGGQVTIRGDEVLTVVCHSCLDDTGYGRTRH